MGVGALTSKITIKTPNILAEGVEYQAVRATNSGCMAPLTTKAKKWIKTTKPMAEINDKPKFFICISHVQNNHRN